MSGVWLGVFMGTTIEIRIRSLVWAATAAALAVVATLLITSAWSADAAPGDDDATFVPIANCRLFDTRAGSDNVGLKNTPIGPGDANAFVQQVTGSNGNCTIPNDAVAVAMNVTIVNPTAQSNLRVFPADIPTPLASNLNWLPGQSPTPNKVDVTLSPAGAIKLFNFNGNVDVVGDVNGYYTNSTLTEIGQRLNTLESAQPFSVEQRRGSVLGVTTAADLITLELAAPVDGSFAITAAAGILETIPGEEAGCSISTSTSTDSDYDWLWQSGGLSDGDRGVVAGTRVIDVAGGATIDVYLVCRNNSGGASIFNDITMTAVFTPAP